jgi:hypothetical protein
VKKLRQICRAVDPDPYVLGPPGSGSVIICADPDPSIIKHYDFLSFKNNVNVPSKSNKQKT